MYILLYTCLIVKICAAIFIPKAAVYPSTSVHRIYAAPGRALLVDQPRMVICGASIKSSTFVLEWKSTRKSNI